MKVFRLFFLFVFVVIVGINVHSAYCSASRSLIEENIEALSAPLSSKTGIPVTRYEDAGETETACVVIQ